MTTPNTYRIAAAFQAEKDPQQDAVIAWLGALPKDSRGGVKRSVMKYHLTRALLLYMQSGADTSTALHIGSGASVAAPVPAARHLPSVASAPAPSPAPAFAASPVSALSVAQGPADSSVPVLTDPVKKSGGKLRNKIATSMKGS